MNIENNTKDKNTIHASAFARVFACPASFRLEQDFPNEETESSQRGSFLHSIMDKGLTPEVAHSLSLEDTQAIQYAVEKVSEIIHNYGYENPDTKVYNEVPVQYIEPNKTEPILKGRIDKVIESESLNSTDIIDYKFGQVSVEDAEENKQLACYAFLWTAMYGKAFTGKHKIRVHIIAPCAFGKHYSVAQYSVDEIRDFWATIILETCRNALTPEYASFSEKPTEACRYCKAIGVCKTQKENVEVVLSEGESALNKGEFAITKDNAIDIFRQLKEWNERKLMAEKYVNKIKESLEAYVKETSDERFEWKSGAKKIDYNAQDVFNFYKQLISPERFVNFCKPNITEIVDFVAQITRESKAQCKRDLDNAMVNLGALIKENKPSLKIKNS